MYFIHPLFYVSMLRNYIPYSSHVFEPLIIQIDENLMYKEEPIAITDRQESYSQNKLY